MWTVLKGLAAFAGVVVLGALIFVECARHGLLTPSETALRARYALPNSKFIEIDGEPIHYVDEGHGDPIVLIHGSFGSLLMWSQWAKALTDHYRVIRFDRPPMGLSGPDPAGRYDTKREMEIIDGLTAKLGVDRFFLAATSSGGISGAAYAAQHPERVRGLILSNIGVEPFKIDTDRLSPMFKLILMVEPVFKGWSPEALWREVLINNFADPAKLSPALVTEWTDLNNRAQRMPPAPGSISNVSPLARTPGDLARITVPTLLLWSANDQEVPVTPVADEGLRLLGAQDKTLEVIPACGHEMPIECGPESAARAGAFFDRVAAAGDSR